MKNFLQNGDNYAFVAETDIKAGDIVVRGGIAGVAANDARAGETVVVCFHGVYGLPKATGAGSAIAEGIRVYATKEAPRVVTVDATKGVPLGHVMEAASDRAPTVIVRLCGG